jgi:hypothetical protein
MLHMATKPCSAQATLVALLDTAFDKRSWHGANLTGSIKGVDARLAARRLRGRKTVWEQVLHAAYWKQRVLNKLAGSSRFPRKGSNWPAMPSGTDQTAWRADVELLRDLHRRLREAVTAHPASRLDAEMIWLIQGAAAHDLYHAGQIKLLLRLLAG